MIIYTKLTFNSHRNNNKKIDDDAELTPVYAYQNNTIKKRK